ncbi:MAG TPA: NUDIX domain-containing protein [Pirellulales bacterium]|nr:NUDIX domain-containing protein [Pirellulales bacterium]
MAKLSAGLLMYRRCSGTLEVLLVHPGGPFWAKKDLGAWSIPKGEHTLEEEPLAAARREFLEETGIEPSGEFLDLGSIKQPSGKTIQAWAFEGNCDATTVSSNTFTLEWPKGSGRMREYPEVDRAEWFTFDEARRRLIAGQLGFLDQLQRLVT